MKIMKILKIWILNWLNLIILKMIIVLKDASILQWRQSKLNGSLIKMLSCMFSSTSLMSRNLRKRRLPISDYTSCSQASLMSFELHLMLLWMLFSLSNSISKLSSISWSRKDLNWKLEKTENLCRETS